LNVPAGSALTPRLVAATVHGRTLVEARAGALPHAWFVGFHGYAQNAAIMLDLLRQVPNDGAWRLVAIQALHPFYNRADQVVANWMTREDRDHAIADNIAYVDAVMHDLEREFGAPRAIVFAGFSQGVAMAYRAAVRGRRAGAAVLAVAGDVPPELLAGAPVRWPRVRIVTGSRDDWYTPAVMARDVASLAAAGAVAEHSVFDGGHEWTADVNAAAGALLADVSRGVS
jgi:predicted esterase